MTTKNKSVLKNYCTAYRHPGSETHRQAVDRFFAGDASINIVHPFNEVTGPGQYNAVFLDTLHNAFENLYRVDYIAFAGIFEEAEWVTATGYYAGRFSKPWLGIQPTHELAYVRFGEFHRMQDGQSVESYIFLDIPELMIAAGQWPISASPGRSRGYTGYLPGPALQDGLSWRDTGIVNSETSASASDVQVKAARSADSVAFVTDMLRKLATEDEAWRPYWHQNMMWYGPAAFGSFIGIENFASFQVPFENTFEGWAGGAADQSRTRHFTRFAEGDYICSGGWPSLSGVQVGEFLNQPATNKLIYMRVCDWWRREDELLTENWVFVDIPHVLLQTGYDVFAQFAAE